MIKLSSISAKAWQANIVVLVLLMLLLGSWRDPNFWLTPSQRGDHLMAEKQFAAAAEVYKDPLQIGIAQYRDGEFKVAAPTFARVPGAIGAFDQGNAWLMHGAYDAAVESYDRALGFRPGWKEAEENKALAIARKKVIDDAGKDRDESSTDAYTPDGIKFDQETQDQEDKPTDMNDPVMSESSLRETWLRRVQTTPGDFLRSKFAYQAAQPDVADSADNVEQKQ